MTEPPRVSQRTRDLNQALNVTSLCLTSCEREDRRHGDGIEEGWKVTVFRLFLDFLNYELFIGASHMSDISPGS